MFRHFCIDRITEKALRTSESEIRSTIVFKKGRQPDSAASLLCLYQSANSGVDR